MATQQTLFDMKPGETGKIKDFCSEDVPMKFYELGIFPGTIVQFKRRLPFGGPICVLLRGSVDSIALRSSEARTILIERVA